MSAADSVGHAVSVAFESDNVEHFCDFGGNLAFGNACRARAECDVVPNCHVRKEGVILENRIDFAFIRRQIRYIFGIEKYLSALGVFKSAGYSEHGGFSAAARAEQGEYFATTNAEADVFYDVDISVVFFNIFKFKKLAHFQMRNEKSKYIYLSLKSFFFKNFRR